MNCPSYIRGSCEARFTGTLPLNPAAPPPCRRASRSGIAMIVVLGLLSLLMITGVAFTILMRIERAGASNLRHTTAARQMAQGGIAYAIAALNRDIGDRQTPVWTNRVFRTAENRTQQERNGKIVDKLRIAEDVFFSVLEDDPQPRNVASARILTAEAAQHLPGALRHRADMLTYNDVEYAAPEWIPVVSEGTVVGRYAYAILETTGLLDANLVNGPDTNRWMGADPAEIRIDPKVQLDVVNVKDFTDQRTIHGRYETLPELTLQNDGLDGKALQNFGTFSYSPPDLIPAEPHPKASGDMITAHEALLTQLRQKGRPRRRIDIGTEQKIKAQQAEIELAFQASGLNAEQSRWAYLGLLDYVDKDHEPAGATNQEKFGRPATEAVPLFSVNGIRMKYVYKALPPKPDGTFDAEHRMSYQHFAYFVYPFRDRSAPFKVEVKAQVRHIPINPGQWGPLTPPMDQVVVLAKDLAPLAPGGVATLLGDEVFYPPENKDPLVLPGSAGKFQGFTLFGLSGVARTMSGNNVIRQLPADDYDKFADGATAVAMNLTGAELEGNVYFLWSEVLDPRNNHRANDFFWRASRDDRKKSDMTYLGPLINLESVFPGYKRPTPQPFPGVVNSLANYMLSHPDIMNNQFKIITDGLRFGDNDATHADTILRQFDMHVADRPLQSVGELGYLPIGFFLTVSLYDHGHKPWNQANHNYANNVLPEIGYHPVLDYFTLDDPEAPSWGRVNLNTVNPEVMGAVFTGLPVQSERVVASPPAIPALGGGNLDDATELAEWLIDKGPFTRLSDLGRMFQDTPQLGKSTPGAYSGSEPLQALTKVVPAGQIGELEREALIRNASELFTLRGQTFTIILRADSFSPRFGMTGVKQGNVLATSTAVVQVWRDTEPIIEKDGTRNYPTFIQSFKMLNE